MRGHDTYFPYSAICPVRFVMPPEAAFGVLWDGRKAVGAVGEAVFRREGGELRTALCFNLLKHGDVRV